MATRRPRFAVPVAPFAYLSGIVRKNILHLPAEVEYVPRRRRPFYVIYAILSGLYGYLLLSFLTVLTFHILQAYTPEWAFVPAIVIGYWRESGPKGMSTSDLF